MPEKDDEVYRQRRPARGIAHQVGKEREPRVRHEDLRTEWKQRGIGHLLDRRNVDLRVVYSEMIAVNENSRGGDCGEGEYSNPAAHG